MTGMWRQVFDMDGCFIMEAIGLFNGGEIARHPKGSQNALKHAYYTATAISQRLDCHGVN
jgi:hypothetical protein